MNIISEQCKSVSYSYTPGQIQWDNPGERGAKWGIKNLTFKDGKREGCVRCTTAAAEVTENDEIKEAKKRPSKGKYLNSVSILVKRSRAY